MQEEFAFHIMNDGYAWPVGWKCEPMGTGKLVGRLGGWKERWMESWMDH